MHASLLSVLGPSANISIEHASVIQCLPQLEVIVNFLLNLKSSFRLFRSIHHYELLVFLCFIATTSITRLLHFAYLAVSTAASEPTRLAYLSAGCGLLQADKVQNILNLSIDVYLTFVSFSTAENLANHIIRSEQLPVALVLRTSFMVCLCALFS